MAMAHRAPAPSGGPRRYVSRHAVERLRARAEVPPTLSDAELARVIDDAVAAALERGEAVEFEDADGDRARAVELAFDGLTVRRGSVWALLKPNSLPGSDRPGEAVVTLLARRPTEPPSPGTPARERGGPPFNPALADALRGVELPPADGPGDSALVPPEPEEALPEYIEGAEVAVSASALAERDRGVAEARELVGKEERRQVALAAVRAELNAAADPPPAEYVLLPRRDLEDNLRTVDRAEALARLERDPELILLRVVPFRVRVELDEGGS